MNEYCQGEDNDVPDEVMTVQVTVSIDSSYSRGKAFAIRELILQEKQTSGLLSSPATKFVTLTVKLTVDTREHPAKHGEIKVSPSLLQMGEYSPTGHMHDKEQSCCDDCCDDDPGVDNLDDDGIIPMTLFVGHPRNMRISIPTA